MYRHQKYHIVKRKPPFQSPKYIFFSAWTVAGLDKNTTKEDYHIGGDQSLVYESDVKVGELASVALVVGAWCTIFLLGGAEERP